MKQKFYTLLLTAVFGLTGMNAWAEDYEIATAADLLDFATAVNSGETTTNAVLTADIDLTGVTWTPIGNSTTKYSGTFDGQGHAITGFSYTTTSGGGHGLFGYVSNATIKDFSISGTLTSTGGTDGSTYIGTIGAAEGTTVIISGIRSSLNINVSNCKTHTGGILGSTVTSGNPVLVESCEYNGTLTHSGTGDCQAGILGYTYNGGVKNCLFSGTIVGESSKYGGILGYCKVPGFLGVQDCLSVGKIVANSGNTTAAAIIANYNGGVTANVKNNYYCFKEGSTTTIAIGNKASSCGEAPHAVTAAQLASGEVCFALNGNVSGGENWFQTLSVPTFELGSEQTYTDVQYVGTINGDDNNPKTQTTDITIINNGDNTIKINLKNFSVIINGVEANVDEISLDNVATSVGEDGLTHFDRENGTFTIPTSDLPPLYQTLVAQGLVSFTDIPFTLHGKLNETQIFSEIDIFISSALGNKNVHIVVGTDDFPTVDAYPTPYGTVKVYANGRSHCNGDPIEGEITYSNEDLGIVPDSHNYVDGFCDYCGALDENYITPNSEGFLEIGNTKELIWFAAYANQKKLSAKGMLTANIDLTGVTWTPIGNADNKYTGTFDGQGHTISNFSLSTTSDYSGFFGHIGKGSVIKNFTIEGSITSNSHQYVGGVIGAAGGGTINISDIHSKVNITCSKSRHGGILGYQSSTGTININRCTYSGTLNPGTVGGNFGGFVGLTFSNASAYINVTNCLFDGKILNEGESTNAGGIIGYSKTCNVTIENCLSYGTILAANPGHFIGQLNATSNQKYAGVNYYVTNGNTQGTGSATEAGPAPIKVTTDQLASGEVGFNLGGNWSQFLDTDAYPTPGVTCPVFYVGPAGYATLFDNNNDWALNGDAQAYIGTANGQYIHLTAIDDIPMSTAVIIKGTYYNKLTTTATSDVSANELLGTEEDTPADGTMYVLAKPEGMEIGFYLAEINTTIPAGKAYYQSTSGVKGFIFADDDATGIEMVNGQSSMVNGSIFNLAGQRLSKMQKGINIVGSKKVLY